MTEEGVAVKCTYEGKIQIAGMPGPVSTLTGDYELALDGATGAVYYYGDYFGVGGGNWIFAIDQPAGGDGVQVDLVVDGLDFENGIPTGTYTASVSQRNLVYSYQCIGRPHRIRTGNGGNH